MKKILSAIIILGECLFIYSIVFETYGMYDVIGREGMSLGQRPFVYRVLVPYVSQFLSWASGLEIQASVIMVTSSFMIGYYLVCVHLYKDLKYPELTAFISCQALFIVTANQFKIYDWSTAFFFALMMYLLTIKKHGCFLAVFAVASLNRETVFLMTIFYILHSGISMKTAINSLIQVIILFCVRTIVSESFSEKSGVEVLHNFDFIINSYAMFWYFSIPMFSFILFMIVKASRSNIAIASLFAIQTILHIYAGMPFEVRVFAESIPALFLVNGEGVSFPDLISSCFAKYPSVKTS